MPLMRDCGIGGFDNCYDVSQQRVSSNDYLEVTVSLPYDGV